MNSEPPQHSEHGIHEQTLLQLLRPALPARQQQAASLRRLPVPETTADATAKYAVEDGRGRVCGFVLVSSADGPDIVQRAVASLDAARQALGPDAGSAVIEPWHHGVLGGRSFALFPYLRPISEARVIGRCQILLLRGRVLRWLRDVARLTSRSPAASAIGSAFTDPLTHLAADAAFPADIRGHAAAAIDRLHRGLWRPRHVLAHNDLWKGNILRTSRRGPRGRGFVVIDWASSRVDGYAIYDLVRVAQSLGLSRRRLRRELSAHCALLDCDMRDAWGHLLAALGHLGRNLEHFPRPRYLAMAVDCCRRLGHALPPSPGSA